MGILLVFSKQTKLLEVELRRLIQVDTMRPLSFVGVGRAERLTPIDAHLFTDLVCLAFLLVQTAHENQVVKGRRVYSLVDQFVVECLNFCGLR